MVLHLAAAALSLALSAAPTEAPADADGKWISKFVPKRGQWELGAFTGLTIIGGRHDFYDPATAPQAKLGRVGPVAGLRGGYYPLSFLGVEAEGLGLWTRVPSRNEEPAFVYALRGQAVLQLPLYRVVPFAVGGYGIAGVRSPMSAVGNDTDPAGHYGAGLKLMADRRFAVRLEGRHMMTPARARRLQVANHFSVLLGLSIRLGPEPSREDRRTHEPAPASPDKDADGDGVRDLSDACPTLAGTFPSGCPAPDHDDDGVPDAIDACPTEAAQGDGCPDKDTDRDGKLDAEDRCPWEAGDDRDGCRPSDGDSDGIPDRDDKCPALSGQHPTGCPEAPTPPEPI